MNRRTVALTSAARVLFSGRTEYVELPPDLPADGERTGPSPPAFHHAPLGTASLPERYRRICDWILRERPALMVVDVSVECTLLSALCGVPVCVVVQQGRRDDLPHRLAYGSAVGLMAPWPSWFEADPRLDGEVSFSGGFSRFDERQLNPPSRPRHLTVLLGSGGAGPPPELLVSWADSMPDWQIDVIGARGAGDRSRGNLTFHGWLDDPWNLICGAEVVLSPAGHNTVCDVAAADRPLVAVAEPRPFGEQSAKVASLEAAGLAVGLDRWPDPLELRRAIASANPPNGPRRSPGPINDGGGAKRMAAAIEELAARAEADCSSFAFRERSGIEAQPPSVSV